VLAAAEGFKIVLQAFSPGIDAGGRQRSALMDVEQGHAVLAAAGIVGPADRDNGLSRLLGIGILIDFEPLRGGVHEFAERFGFGCRIFTADE
jgi:hypothetical protein